MAKRIGELLVEGGVLSQSQLEQALFAQRKDGRKLGQLLIELGLVTETQLTQTLSRQLSVPWVSLYHVDFSRSLLNLVSREVAERFSVVPILVRRVRKQGDTLYIAMDDPTNEAAIEDIGRAVSMAVKPMIACPSDIRAAIRVYYLGEAAPPPAADTASPPPVGPRSVPSPPKKPSVRPAKPRESGPPRQVPAARELRPAREAPPAREAAPARDAPAARETSHERESSTATAQEGLHENGASLDSPPAPDSRPQVDAAPPPARPRMISLTLLDGTSITIPAPTKKPSRPDLEKSTDDEVNDQLTARDLVSALRAVAHGAEANEILGAEPRWEAMFSALLSILLRKGLIADWEFIDEFRKI